MFILSEYQVIELFDGVSCALLAAAASAKARAQGSHLSGAAALGFICGILGPLVREMLLHGETGGQLIIKLLPDDVFIGSLGGIAAVRLVSRLPVVFWLDALSVSFASVLGCLLALQELGIAAGLCLGLICGFLPGVFRDVALGDLADLVEKDWYASSCVLGCVIGMCVFMSPFFFSPLAIMENRLLEISCLSGIACAFLLQIKNSKKIRQGC